MRKAIFATALSFVLVSFSAANDAKALMRTPTDIPAQSLSTALKALAKARDLQVLYFSEAVRGKETHGAAGELTADEAFSQLLSGTGLTFRYLDAKTVSIYPLSTGPDGRQSSAASTQVQSSTEAPRSFWQRLTLSQAEQKQEASQTQSQNSADNDGKLEEVVVTAQKREERMKDVPMSITALSGDTLSRSGITSTEDLEMSVPGMRFTSVAQLSNISIRGISSGLQGVTTDPSAAVYLDGVYQPRFESALFDLLDIKQVEVLKGPQVVLYGRNAAAGAISYISNEPGNQFGGKVDVEAGNFNLLRVNAAVDVPLIPGKLLVRAAGISLKHDGFTTNVINPADHPGAADSLGGRLTVKFLPTDELSLTVRAARFVENGSHNPPKALDPLNPFFGSSYDLKDVRTTSANQITTMPSRKTDVSATLKWDLGWSKLTAITGYADLTFGPNAYDSDSTENVIYQSGVTNQPATGLAGVSRVKSQEVNLSGNAGRLDWLTGATYFKENARDSGGDVFFGTGPYYFPGTSDTKAYAAYGQMGYAVTEKLKFSAGLRYSHESKETGRCCDAGVLAMVPSPPLFLTTTSWSATTPEFTATFHPSADHMLYATVAKGFKSGGYNLFDLNPAFNPEHVTSYEIGSKSTWIGGRVGLDLSLFRYDYTDLQIDHFIPPLTRIYENAGTARGKGAEMTAHLLPVQNLQFDLGLALLDAKFTQYDTHNDAGVAVSLAGNQLPLAPRVTSNLATSYRIEMGDIGHIVLFGNLYYTSKHYFTPFNEANLAQGGYSMINARISFVPRNSSFELGVFGKNLTDKVALMYGFNATAPIVVADDPRTWGLELKYSF